MKVKPLYIFISFMFSLTSCQWIVDHPKEVQQIEKDLEDMIDETEKDIVPLFPIIEAAI